MSEEYIQTTGDTIKYFFEAKSVAIIGATANKTKLGWHIVENFLKQFPGKTYYVNPKGGEIEGEPIYKKLKEVPEPVDTVVIIIPAKYVLEVIEDSVKIGAKTIIVESGGFAEVSEEGKEMQRKIVETVKGTGIRIMGPNCVGILSPSQGIDTIFIPLSRVARPGEGPIAMMTQSGALAAAVLDQFTLEGDGNWISRLASFGNAADVNEYDLLRYFGQDEKTKIIVAHLEGFKRGADFLAEAKKITPKKPVVILKTGRTKLGSKASQSHSASLAADDAVVESLLKQHGIVRVNELKDLIMLAKAFATQPVPRGPKVGIITDGGGFSVMGSDFVDMFGLELGELSKRTTDSLIATYPSYYISKNPLDLTGMVSDEEFMFGVEKMFLDPNIDIIFTIIIPSAPRINVPGLLERMTHFITKVRPNNPESAQKPIFSLTIGGEEGRIIDSKFEKLDIPTFRSAHEAIKIISYMVEYRQFLDRNSKYGRT